ncbi:MAG: DNA polymerase III subunit alpha [Desulfobacteraceae bacterium]|jgi:DNA polymerase-3 subunit alpha
MTIIQSNDFVHLHLHTQYSLLDGAIRLGPLFKRAAEFGMHSVSITDHGTMFGVVDFYQQALKNNIKPIIGCECYLAPRTIHDKTAQDNRGLSHLVLLAENQEGYNNLCKLVSIAQLQGFYYKPRIDRELLKAHNKGLIALSACLHGEIPRRIVEGNIDKAIAAAHFYLETFGEGNFFLEIQKNDIPIQDKVNQALLDLSQQLSIPLVATNDCHYLDRTDVRAHDVLLCIQTGKTVKDKERFRFSTDQLYFKSKEDMIRDFSAYEGAIENTVAVAKRCHVEFDFNNYHFPQFSAESNLSASELFINKVEDGFVRVWKIITRKNPEADKKKYRERLDYEVKVINDMGFPGYFLIVADFINYAKDNGVPVGPGRGSAAGSLVAYSMGITDLDPLEHGLIFERFLNPSRISMPDIDVDFCINGRERVFKYVVDRYGGGDYVAQIITFGKMKTRLVIRDVGRALDMPLAEVDTIAKLVPDKLNISLEDALDQEPKLSEMARTRPDVAELIEICRVLEGLPRHASTHAAGVVIGDKPLVDYLPLYKGKKGEVVTQLDMKLVEKIGLVKFDFLGLRNLTVIDNTFKLITQGGKTPPDFSNLDFNDNPTYQLLSTGDTTGVFQLESSGMKDLLVRLKPECFDDITALVALYRPGPLDSGMVDDFVERKHGRKAVEYLIPELESILKETYGVIVYQEQVMKIAAELANYSMAEADGLRKAMGKKIQAMMIEHRERFMKGSKENNIPEDKAKEIFDLMEKFGGYGFNKSHSAAYALISYQTAYLKTHFPVEFMAALLTSEMNSIDGVVKFITECRSHDIDILPPDINASNKAFTVTDNKIRFGLVAVKNVGEGAIEAIIEARDEKGTFSNLFDFCERVDLRKVNKRVIESLIRCGAFDSTNDYRSRMIAALEDALDYGQRIQKERSDPQMGLFDFGDASQATLNVPPLPLIDEWEESEFLMYEKEALGFYISRHPLERYRSQLEKYANVTAETIKESSDRSTVRFGGLVRTTKVIRTKKEELMAFATVEDLYGSVEAVIFPTAYSKVSDLLVEDVPIFLQGEVQKEEKNVKILVDTIIPMEKAEELWTATIHIHMDVEKINRDILSELHRILNQYPGTCRTFLHLVMEQKIETVIAVEENMGIKSCTALNRDVSALLGPDALKTGCSPVSTASRSNGNHIEPKRGKNNYARFQA